VLAQTARLLFVGTGGWWLVDARCHRAEIFSTLAAASMVVLGVLSCQQRDS